MQPDLLRVALVTCRELPQLDDDTRCLIAPLAERGVMATPAIWDDRDVDWTRFDLAIVRSCWDYVPRRAEFLCWAARLPQLANPAAVLAWNTHKQCLRELAARGVPVVPTAWLQPNHAWLPPASGEWVIKPAVSMASLDTGRYDMQDQCRRRQAVEHVARLQAEGRTVMVQPYASRIEDEGETSLVFVDGVFSHATRKAAVLTGPDVGMDRRFQSQGCVHPRNHEPTAQEFLIADHALAAVPGGRERLLYARVDLVPDLEGGPVVMELELTEPQLCFGDAHGAADRMAVAIAKRALGAKANEYMFKPDTVIGALEEERWSGQ